MIAYSKALKGRRDKMYLGYSWGDTEVRYPEWRTFEKLKQGFRRRAEGRPAWSTSTCGGSPAWSRAASTTTATVEELIEALDWAKKSGRARFTGISSHDRPHIKKLIEKYPEQLEVICTPYTAKTKVVTDESGLWAAMKKHDVGWFGIKPFASNSLFKGDSTPEQSARGGGQPPRPAGHPLHPLQPGDHRADPRADHRRAGRQRGPGRQGTPRAGRGGEGRTGPGHGPRLGQPARHYQWLKDWEYV